MVELLNDIRTWQIAVLLLYLFAGNQYWRVTMLTTSDPNNAEQMAFLAALKMGTLPALIVKGTYLIVWLPLNVALWMIFRLPILVRRLMGKSRQ